MIQLTENQRGYVLSVNLRPIMFDIDVGRARMAQRGQAGSGDTCGYCGHRLTTHLRTTHVMRTAVECRVCASPCVAWEHVPESVPSDSLITYELPEDPEEEPEPVSHRYRHYSEADGLEAWQQFMAQNEGDDFVWRLA